MLHSLHIENMAIISSLDVDFDNGLSVITGETGAGKSVLIDCISFLLGGKVTRELLRRGSDRGVVAAVFSDISEDCRHYLIEMDFSSHEELMLQRTLTADGKTQARLNGRVIPQAMLRELSKYLVSIHGQNDNQLLLQSAMQKRILDLVADVDADLVVYRSTYAARAAALQKLQDAERDSAEKNRLRDILRFQITEIGEAKLKNGEEEQLLLRRNKLQNAERIAKQASFVYHVLYGSEKSSASLILERAANALLQISSVVPEASALSEKLMSMRYDVEDIANTTHDFSEEIDGNPTEALNAVESRLDVISKLCRKYGSDIPAVLEFAQKAEAQLYALDHAEEVTDALRREIEERETVMQSVSERLHSARKAAADKLMNRMKEELIFLDMPAVRFDILVTEQREFLPDGKDEIVFCMAANKGEALMPLSRVASGGELARVMLALKSVLNDADGVGTAVFDEVDTGISGKTARKLGMKLADMGKTTQVVCVTHSAQIASLATTHYKIVKYEQEGRTLSNIVPLDEEARIDEVARILGGISVTETQRRAAAEMITEGACYR